MGVFCSVGNEKLPSFINEKSPCLVVVRAERDDDMIVLSFV